MTVNSDTIVSILRALMFGGCWWWWSCSGLWGNDEFERYVQRTDTVTFEGGDAKEVNAITHMYSPWPRGVMDRRIVTDGDHMQRALERYRRGATPPDPMPDLDVDSTRFGFALPPEKSQGSAGGTGAGPAASSYPGQ